MIKIGWIGCGTHASEMLLPQLVRLPVKIAALCDVDEKRLAQIADRYGVAARYAEAAQMLAHEELDAIGMALGPTMHLELVCRHCPAAYLFFME
jgi:myo-inositol 2-dehydrogenase / D-chiro-inositol 1-dehydrogenase